MQHNPILFLKVYMHIERKRMREGEEEGETDRKVLG